MVWPAVVDDDSRDGQTEIPSDDCLFLLKPQYPLPTSTHGKILRILERGYLGMVEPKRETIHYMYVLIVSVLMFP